jgi:hypothetical protein
MSQENKTTFKAGDILFDPFLHMHVVVLSNDDPNPKYKYRMMILKDTYDRSGEILKYSEYAARGAFNKVG